MGLAGYVKCRQLTKKVFDQLITRFQLRLRMRLGLAVSTEANPRTLFDTNDAQLVP
jgi:hypothetical protein